MRRKSDWPNIVKIVDAGGELHIVTENYGMCVSSLTSDQQLVCMIESSGGEFLSIMAEIETLAERFNKEGIVTDRINGTEYRLD